MLSLIVAAVAATTQPSPPAPKTPVNSCRPPETCRFVPSFTLHDPGHAPAEVRVDRWLPYLEPDGTLVISPGETFVIRLAKDGTGLKPQVVSAGRADRLVKDARDREMEAKSLEANGKETVWTTTDPRGVAAVRADPDTVRLTFEQVEGRADMLLKVDNGYGRAIDFRAAMLRLGARAPEPTTVCVVKPGVLNHEAWPDPIVMIKLSGFAFVDDPRTLDLSHCD